MENAFKKLQTQENVPNQLRERVMESVTLAKMFIDLAELFTGRYIETIGHLFRTNNGSQAEQ